MNRRAARHSSAAGRRQGGQEILEFGLVALCLYTPLLLGTFVVGMNLVKTIQAKNTVRDMADMYIHGADFSDGGYQTLTKELATGLNLQSPRTHPVRRQGTIPALPETASSG